MPTTYKILGSAFPGTTGAVLYTVPATGNAVISSIVISNIATGSRTFRIAVKPNAATNTATNHYLAYDTVVPNNDTIILAVGLTLSGSNVVHVSGSSTDVAFNAFGSEIT